MGVLRKWRQEESRSGGSVVGLNVRGKLWKYEHVLTEGVIGS